MKAIVRPEWWAVMVDETAHYNIDEADRPFIEKIVGVYFYDRNEHTYLCEGTPSYFLRYLYDAVWVVEGCPDEKREELCEEYENLGGDDCYFHVYTVDAWPEENKVAFGEVVGDVEDEEEYVRQYWQGNCPF